MHITNRILHYAVIISAATGLLVSRLGADPTQPHDSASTVADAAWQALQPLLNGNGRGPAIPGLIDAADQFSAFAQHYPTHGKANDARCLEAIMLARAALAGDSSHESRRTATTAANLHDTNVTPSVRAELIATTDSISVVRGSYASLDATLAAYERSSRGLISEFPDLPNGYESLLGIARDSSDTHGAALAAEIATLAGAPEWIKAAAALLSRRFAMIGQPLPAGISSSIGKPTIVYAWSLNDVGSRARARACAAKAPASVVFIGVCVDSDVSAAQSQAQSDNLPGIQVYDVKGADGAVAQALSITSSGVMYGADRSGTVRSVALQRDLGAAFLASNL